MFWTSFHYSIYASEGRNMDITSIPNLLLPEVFTFSDPLNVYPWKAHNEKSAMDFWEAILRNMGLGVKRRLETWRAYVSYKENMSRIVDRTYRKFFRDRFLKSLLKKCFKNAFLELKIAFSKSKKGALLPKHGFRNETLKRAISASF